MPRLKNQLIPTVPSKTKEVIQSLKHTEDTYRQDEAPKLYDKVLRYPRKNIDSDEFINLVYDTLKAFNMDSKGAKLSDCGVFKESIKKHLGTIQSLTKVKLESVKENDSTIQKSIVSLFGLFDDYQLVKTESPLVTFSKTMHFFLPDLFMPIDRKYTLQFFYGNRPYKKINYGLYHLTETHEKQKECYLQVFEEFRNFAAEHYDKVLKKQVDQNSRWNRNIPKVIDNLIIAYVSQDFTS